MTVGVRLRIAGAIASVILFFALFFAIAFLATDILYQNLGQHPPAWATQMINSLAGLLLGMLTLSGLGAYFGSRRWSRQRTLFGPIIDALRRIAKGDFSVHLGGEVHGDGPVGELVKSVNDMAVELDQMERMRQEFISNVSHEIQSPLTSIRGFAEALQNAELRPEERRHYLAIIETESTRLSRITDNLLKLASLESDRVRFEPQSYRLDRQIRNAILACEPQWAGKGIDMDIALEDVDVVGDEDLLSQVWTNLIHNSIKFTPDGGRVSIGLCRKANHVEFKIQDTGIGISESDQIHVFERFYKADRARERSKEGSGLGLAIVNKIVAMHKGTIALESQLGVGTTFTVTLPAASV